MVQSCCLSLMTTQLPEHTKKPSLSKGYLCLPSPWMIYLGFMFGMELTKMGPSIQAVFEITCGNLIQIYQIEGEYDRSCS
jgi:hypothetical protein